MISQYEWETTEICRMRGALMLRAWRGYQSCTWFATAYVAATRTCHCVEWSFDTRSDAVGALEDYADQLGPVEPVLALLGAFSCAGHVRRARKVAA